jgi:crossover junction endodeoxyribonuclease RusA
MYELTLPYSSPPLSMNDRTHWRTQLAIKRQIDGDVRLLALHKRLPKGCAKADITLVWHPSVKRRRDTDNPMPTLKAAIDSLVRYGLVADDSSDIVSSGVVIGELRSPAELILRIEVS